MTAGAADPLPITGDSDADRLLAENPFALLLGMLLDQQVPMEWAFRGPATLRDRLDGDLTPATLAALGPEAVEERFRAKPALHRYPGSMGRRAHQLACHIVEQYDGDASAIWAAAEDADELFRRLLALPGFGEEKARIFLAVLAKRFDRAPADWRELAGPFGDDTPRSVADVADATSLSAVREWKKAQKAKGKRKDQ